MLDPIVLAGAGRLWLKGTVCVTAPVLRLAFVGATILVAGLLATPAEPLRYEAAVAIDRGAGLPGSAREPE